MLIDEPTLKACPPLYGQEEEDDPIIYAKIATRDDNWACYVAEAGKKDGHYTIFGLFISKKWGHNWAQVPLHEVEQDLKRANLEASLVQGFRPASASNLTRIRRRVRRASGELSIA